MALVPLIVRILREVPVEEILRLVEKPNEIVAESWLDWRSSCIELMAQLVFE